MATPYKNTTGQDKIVIQSFTQKKIYNFLLVLGPGIKPILVAYFSVPSCVKD